MKHIRNYFTNINYIILIISMAIGLKTVTYMHQVLKIKYDNLNDFYTGWSIFYNINKKFDMYYMYIYLALSFSLYVLFNLCFSLIQKYMQKNTKKYNKKKNKKHGTKR